VSSAAMAHLFPDCGPDLQLDFVLEGRAERWPIKLVRETGRGRMTVGWPAVRTFLGVAGLEVEVELTRAGLGTREVALRRVKDARGGCGHRVSLLHTLLSRCA